tara:strand:- start:683 stop:895 length:213 start_codon:yes stop_codon:yes gene_type:complete
MKKYEHKMYLLDNETLWEESGLQKSGWTGGDTNKAGDLKFANELGNEGFELVAVVQYGTKSGYFFKREIV